MMLAVVHRLTCHGTPLERWRIDEGVDAHRRHGLDRVAEALALVDAGRADAERHHVGRQALGRRLERQAGARRVLEEQVAHRLAAQRRHLRVRPLVDLDHRVGEVEQAQHAVDADLADRAQVLHDAPPRHEGCSGAPTISTPSGQTRTSSLRLVGQVLADEVGADRQLAVAAVDEHGELHGAGPAVLGDGVEGGAHGAAGEQHVVDEHDGGAVEVDRGSRCVRRARRAAGRCRRGTARRRSCRPAPGARCGRSRRRGAGPARRRPSAGRAARDRRGHRCARGSRAPCGSSPAARRRGRGRAWRSWSSRSLVSSVRASRDPLHGRRRG